MRRFTPFMSLSAELKTIIIQKCYPIPYVRLRASCRFMDEFCEINRKQLGIYCYRKDPRLELITSLGGINCLRKVDNSAKLVYLTINYGKDSKDRNFIVPMVRENLSKIRACLSGFAFTHAYVQNSFFSQETEKHEEFNNSLVCFLELAADFNVKYAEFGNLTLAQAKLLTDIWTVISVTFYPRKIPLQEFLKLDVVKRARSIEYTTFISRDIFDEKLIEKAATGKKCVAITTARGLSIPKICNAMDNIMKKRYDIWINQIEDKEYWQLVTIERDWSMCDGCFLVKTATCRRQFVMMILDIIVLLFAKIPLDYSIFYEMMVQQETLEDIRDVYTVIYGIVKLIETSY